MIPAYDAVLPEGWRATAWEPPHPELAELLETRPIEALTRFVERHPASSDGYNALGIAHALQTHWPQALQAFNHAVFLSNQYHHYIHYLCSAVHTLCAESASDAVAREAAISAALFQDHTNARILALQAAQPLPHYEHALWEDSEWPQNIRVPQGVMTDTAWNSGEWLCRDGASVRAQARQSPQQAALLADRWHKHYHRQASIHRLHRGRVQEAMGEIWLARDEYRHAHDIDPSFAAPLHRRAALERTLGNESAAAADEAKAERLVSPRKRGEVGGG